MGVTDVHSVPVPIETQDLHTNHYPRTKYVGVDGCGMQLHVTPPMRDHLCFTTTFDGT